MHWIGRTVAMAVLPAMMLCTVPSMGSGGQAASNQEIVQHFQAGQQDLNSGKVNEAVEQFREVLQLAPNLSEAHVNLGLAYHLLGQFKLAVRELEKGLAQNPNVLGGNIILGLDELKLGDPGQAVLPLRQALRIDPSNQQAWSTLGDAYLGLRNYPEASRAYQNAFGKEQSADNWFHLGHAYLQMSSQLTARMAHEDAGTAWAERLAGDLLSERQLWSDATRRYQLALERDPAEPGLHASLAHALLEQGRSTQAERELQSERKVDTRISGLAQTGPDTLSLDRARLIELGNTDFASHRYVQASDAFAAAWTRNRKDPQSLYWLIRSYSKMADGYFAKLALRDPNSAQAHQLEAESYRARGDDSKAVQQYQLAAQMQPDNASLHEALGELYLDAHELPQAHEELAKALQLDPARARTLYLIGRLEIGVQRPQLAIPYLERALRYDPHLLEARASLGLAYLRAGQPALALPQLERSTSLDYYGDLHYMLYQAYRDLGKKELAQRALAASQAMRRKTASRDQALIRSAENR